MKIHVLSLCLALLLPGSIAAWQQPASSPAARSVPALDFAAILGEINVALARARNGEYGTIDAEARRRIATARTDIEILMQGHASIDELTPDEQLELFNQKELLLAALRGKDADRKICKRETIIGSRLTQIECLTVAQREIRAYYSRELVKDVQRKNCRVGARRC